MVFATGVLDRDFDSDRLFDNAHMASSPAEIKPYLACNTCHTSYSSLITTKLQERHAPSYSAVSQQFVKSLEAACNATPLAYYDMSQNWVKRTEPRAYLGALSALMTVRLDCFGRTLSGYANRLATMN